MCVCVLQNLALEIAFPKIGISHVEAWLVRENEELIVRLENGWAYQKATFYGPFVSGSRPEGLAMDDHWGHNNADRDLMWLHGGPLGVHVAGGQQQRGRSCLDFCPEGCPPAYTKLQVTDLPTLRQKSWIKEVHETGNQCWLNVFRALVDRPVPLSTGRSGPAVQVDQDDYVPTLVCNGPHPDIQHEFAKRPRQWPSATLIAFLLKLPMLLVLVGHKLSAEFPLQARVSWSHLELKLIQELAVNVRQGYIACKYVLKRFLKARRGQNEAGDGRSNVGSYHLKTAFLRYLENKHPLYMITMTPFEIFVDLLHELDEHFKVGKLPHYFLAQCNLLETVEKGELCIARQVIEEILTDPLNALLTTPTDPIQIYGAVHPDSLVVAFRRFSSHPTCEQSQEELSGLLARVLETRRRFGMFA